MIEGPLTTTHLMIHINRHEAQCKSERDIDRLVHARKHKLNKKTEPKGPKATNKHQPRELAELVPSPPSNFDKLLLHLVGAGHLSHELQVSLVLCHCPGSHCTIRVCSFPFRRRMPALVDARVAAAPQQAGGVVVLSGHM